MVPGTGPQFWLQRPQLCGTDPVQATCQGSHAQPRRQHGISVGRGYLPRLQQVVQHLHRPLEQWRRGRSYNAETARMREMVRRPPRQPTGHSVVYLRTSSHARSIPSRRPCWSRWSYRAFIGAAAESTHQHRRLGSTRLHRRMCPVYLHSATPTSSTWCNPQLYVPRTYGRGHRPNRSWQTTNCPTRRTCQRGHGQGDRALRTTTTTTTCCYADGVSTS